MERFQGNGDLKRFVEYCQNNQVDFSVPDMKYYSCVALCAFDAVFSIRANYEKLVSPTMDRFCELLGIQRKAPNPEVMPEENEQIKVSDLAEMLKMYNPSQLADAINNRQRTDTKKDSILKTQAFYEYMEVFRQFKVDTYQDLNDILRGNPKFEASLRVIRGQANVAVTYFLMLAGDVNGVKVDTQLTRFAQNAVGRRMNQEEISDLFKRAAEYYSQNGYPDMTPRHLDHIVWNWQRAR